MSTRNEGSILRRHDIMTSPRGVKCGWNVITADKYSFLQS